MPQAMNQNNLDIMNAISGVGAQTPQSTMSTQTGIGDMSSGLPQMQGGIDSNLGYQNTIQNFGAGQQQQFNPLQQMYNPMIRHGVGKDQWSSNMGLDQQAILQNIGLGGM